jgi:hypothetical protein
MMKRYAGLLDAWRSREAIAARGVPVIRVAALAPAAVTLMR